MMFVGAADSDGWLPPAISSCFHPDFRDFLKDPLLAVVCDSKSDRSKAVMAMDLFPIRKLTKRCSRTQPYWRSSSKS